MIPREAFDQVLLSSLKPVRGFLDDAAVSEILINGPGEVFVERSGLLERTDARFDAPADLQAALQCLAQYVGRPLDDAHLVLEGRLPDGSRVEAVLPPAAPAGPVVAIRRFSKCALTVQRLVELGALSDEAVAYLRAALACRLNVVVAGGTGSGKTSLLNALSSLVPGGERVVVIEDAKELQLQGDHVVHLEARPPGASGRGAVTIRDLFRATLRLRPDRIVLGEIRGAEALELVQAMTSGHGGCLATVHATHAADALRRLETMALMSDVALPLAALREQIVSAIDVVVETARLRDGRRCVTRVAETGGSDEHAGYVVRDIMARDETPEEVGPLLPTRHVPRSASLVERMRTQRELPAIWNRGGS